MFDAEYIVSVQPWSFAGVVDFCVHSSGVQLPGRVTMSITSGATRSTIHLEPSDAKHLAEALLKYANAESEANKRSSSISRLLEKFNAFGSNE